MISTRRPPPVLTLASYPTSPFQSLIVADPSVYDAHRYYYERQPIKTRVVLGVEGLAAQLAHCYMRAAEAGFPLFFRMDDDLPPKTFVHKQGRYPTLEEVVVTAHECMLVTRTSLVGFHNGANRHWMGEDYKRTWGLVHGGASLSISSNEPEQFIDPTLVYADDVYRTCAHRKRDGAVGRVSFIGFDKKKSTEVAGGSSRVRNQELQKENTELILRTFPDMVTCEGTRWIDCDTFEIPNWRMRRDPGFRP